MNSASVRVALLKAASYEKELIFASVSRVLDEARLGVARSERVLVKPNLLLAKELACAHPLVTAAVCQWLLERGALVEVGDSPGFGRVEYVARRIGLTDALRPLGLSVLPLEKPVSVSLDLDCGAKIQLPISRRALAADRLVSVAKVKAHAQMRMTLSVKNCFGCVPGLRKAMLHARAGATHQLFASVIAAVWARLPRVTGVADGVLAMHVTGPSKGRPYALGLLGASVSAPALDAAILDALGVSRASVPVQARLAYAESPEFPLERPENFSAEGFLVPRQLASASFNPGRLAVSLARRLWKWRLR